MDDERALTEALGRLLSARGHEVRFAVDAESAVQALRNAPCDFVLLDHVLPGETGMQALPRLRRLTKAPIHVMSGYTDDDTRRDALLLGADGFVPKPVEPAALLKAIADLPEASA